MSWDVFISKTLECDEPMGSFSALRRIFSERWPTIDWHRGNSGVSRGERGFSLEIHGARMMHELANAMQDGESLDVDRAMEIVLADPDDSESACSVTVSGGYEALADFTSLCRERGWMMVDLQHGEPIDLDNPYARYDG